LFLTSVSQDIFAKIPDSLKALHGTLENKSTMMRRKILILPVLVVLIAYSCATTKYPAYLTINAQGEDSCLFKQITTEGQLLPGPDVIKSKDKIRWYTGSLFDVSSDGENIAYIAQTSTSDESIYIKSLTADTNSVRRTINISAANPRFSPDGMSICFSGTLIGQENSNICIIDTYEGNAVRHLTDKQAGEDSAPVFSSDGAEVIFTRGLPVQKVDGSKITVTWYYSIWSAGLSIPGTTQFIEGSAPDYLFDNKILYTKTNPSTFQGEIWIYDLITGSDSLILCDAGRGFSTPRVSPDGQRIICTGQTKGKKREESNLDIYLCNIDGTNLQQITFHPGTDASPCWSPDGNSIYFVSQRGNINGYYNIWSVDLNLTSNTLSE